MKNEKQQGLGREFYDIFDDKVIKEAKRKENIKNLTEILTIAKESSSLEDFISKIQNMIDSENNN